MRIDTESRVSGDMTSKRRNGSALRSNQRPPVGAGSDGIVGQEIFAHALSFERLRSERSGAPFLLMLLRVDPAHVGGEASRLAAIGKALIGANRATDITGWYEARHTLGTIFTTLHNADRAAVQATLQAKVTHVVASVVGSSEVRQFRVSFHFFPEEPQDGSSGTPLDDKLYPDLLPSETSARPSRWKRPLDILGSVTALILLSPVLLAIAALVKLSSRGPILFKQKRLGRFGREFTFLKFRSMYVDNNDEIHRRYVQGLIQQGAQNGGQNGAAAKGSNGVYKLTADPRITPIGRFIRKTSLDELPQLINVLRGDMSLVGPRPPIPYEFECYSAWHRRRLLEVPPGITGLWQVTGRSRTTFDDMVRLDLNYIRRQSLWLDLKILLRTPLAVLSRGGAY
jgi:lipopolysaccharide/colanic/teichoic acid biosynthesis glycosyltransferase